MRTLACLSLAILLPACTMMDANKGTYFTNADNQKVKMEFSGGKITHYEAESNLHSPIVKAHWHGAIGLGGEVLGASMAGGAGGAMVGAATTAASAIVNRPTTRGAATPAPVVAKPAQP
jgi:hypothetical protein